MPPKILRPDGKGGVLDQPKTATRSKPKPYVMGEFLKEYIRNRDRYFWKQAVKEGDVKTMDYLKEKYGIE